MDVIIIVMLLSVFIIVTICVILSTMNNNTIVSSDSTLFLSIPSEQIDVAEYCNTLYAIYPQARLDNVMPTWYNLSVRRVEQGYSGIVRCSTSRNTRTPAFSCPYRVNLNKYGKILSVNCIDLAVQFTENVKNVLAIGIEDPKLFVYHGEEWAICNSLCHPAQRNPAVNTMCIFKIMDPSNTFRFLYHPLISPNQSQKNWSPFEYQGNLYCEYTLVPHVILAVNVNNGSVKLAYSSGDQGKDITHGSSLRGGAPPVLFENNYLGIGHTQLTAGHYYHFFYTFEARPPFAIAKMSKPFKLDGGERIQFVVGLSSYKNKIYVSYGVNDSTNRISIFSSDRVKELLENSNQ